MGKKGPPYKPPGDAQWIVVLFPPHTIQNDGQIDYTPLEYWLRALLSDQRAAKFIYEIQTEPELVVIVELPSPEELHFPDAAYGRHSLRHGLKRRPWFAHNTGFTVIMPYNFEHLGHPEDTRKLQPMICGDCEDDWLKFDLTIPYPIPQHFDFSLIPQRVRMFCRRPPQVMPPPPDPMEIERYPTPPTQEHNRAQNHHRASQQDNEQPLFIPEDDSKSKIKNLDPYQEEESISSFLRGSLSAADASRQGVKPEPRRNLVVEGGVPLNANTNDRESNGLPSRAVDELGENTLSAKQEFSTQDDAESRRMHQLLQTVNRSLSPSEDDRLTVKRELENQDSASAQKMYEVLEAANKGQGTHGEGPYDGIMKRGIGAQNEELGVNNHSRHPGSGTSGPLYSAPASDRARGGSKDGYRSTSSNSNANPSRDRDERGGRGRERERDDRAWQEDRERGRELTGSGERKRSLVYTDDRDDRRSGDGREYPDKRSRANHQ